MKAAQRLLLVTVQQLFPFLGNYCPDNLVFKSGRPIQLDVFVPKFLLAFEYQVFLGFCSTNWCQKGEQHYSDIYPLGGMLENELRDAEKRAVCESAGICLIEIPYWWDLTKESLAATIHRHKPQLLPLPPNSQAIPLTPASKKGSKGITQSSEIENWWWFMFVEASKKELKKIGLWLVGWM